jgi:uncharacterized protein (DUF305 family)
MTFKTLKYALAALAFSPFALAGGFASSADAMGCCCGGKTMTQKGKSSGGCMGGAAAKGGKSAMSCMKGLDMADMSTAQKSSDDQMMSGAGMDHSKMDQMDMPGMDHSKMDMSGEKPADDANADVAFAKAMIEHHEGALAMAKSHLKDGKNEEIKKMAEEMISVQTKEIKLLYGWLAKNVE